MTAPLKQFAYVRQFQCLGAECEDTCCKGWGMQLDASHKTLYEKEAPELLSAIDSGEVALIMKRDLATDYCVKFDNGLCGIHKQYGDRFLGDACHFYPRITRDIHGTHVMSAALSCPEIVRLICTLENPFALEDSTLERLPMHIKNAAPNELTAEQALAVTHGFLKLVQDEHITAERAMARVITIALSLASVPVAIWPTGVEVGLTTADIRMMPAEPDPMDPYTLVQTLCGLLHASKKTARPRLDATLTIWQQALGIRLDPETYDVLMDANKSTATQLLTERWQQLSQQQLAPILKRWIQAQIAMSLFPFAGFGTTITERVVTLAVRFATLRWALMAHMQEDGTLPDEATTFRVIQSLARFMDHLADPTLSMNFYTQAGWTREQRLRALVGDV